MKAVIEVCKYRFKILTLTINSYADPWVSLLQLLSLTSSFAVSDLLPLSLSPLPGLPTGLNPLSCQTSVIPFCSFRIHCCYPHAVCNCRSWTVCCIWTNLGQALWSILSEIDGSVWLSSQNDSLRTEVTATVRTDGYCSLWLTGDKLLYI